MCIWPLNMYLLSSIYKINKNCVKLVSHMFQSHNLIARTPLFEALDRVFNYSYELLSHNFLCIIVHGPNVHRMLPWNISVMEVKLLLSFEFLFCPPRSKWKILHRNISYDPLLTPMVEIIIIITRKRKTP